MSLRNGNEYFPKLCGAEVYACNAGEMKCRVSGGTTANPGTKWRWNEMHIPQAHGQSTRNIFIFCTTIGWWGLLWFFYIGGTPKHSPFRCNKLTALPERRLVSFGVDSPQYEK